MIGVQSSVPPHIYVSGFRAVGKLYREVLEWLEQTGGLIKLPT